MCVVGVMALIAGLPLKARMIGGFPILSVVGYLVMWGGAVEVVTVPVLRRAVRMAAHAARWARQEPGRNV